MYTLPTVIPQSYNFFPKNKTKNFESHAGQERTSNLGDLDLFICLFSFFLFLFFFFFFFRNRELLVGYYCN